MNETWNWLCKEIIRFYPVANRRNRTTLQCGLGLLIYFLQPSISLLEKTFPLRNLCRSGEKSLIFPFNTFCTCLAYIQIILIFNCTDYLQAQHCQISMFLFLIWAPSSEFVSSSIPSWQILTAHAQPFRGARDLAFCLKVPLDSLLVWASSEGSGETARMRSIYM